MKLASILQILKRPFVRHNATTNEDTPLILAAREGKVEVVKELLADKRIDVKDASQDTAINS